MSLRIGQTLSQGHEGAEAVADGDPLHMSPPRLSVFDLDRTLTRRGTYLPFLIHAALRLRPWRLALLPAVALCMAAYKLGMVTRTRLKELMQRTLLGRSIRGAQIRGAAEHYAARLCATGCHAQARSLVQAELEQGRIVMLATAAPRFYAQPVGRRLGIDRVIATESHWIGETLFSRIDGLNCYGAEKAAMFERRLSREGLDGRAVHIRFFSDDVSDLPMFERADEPVAVNPSRRLRVLAAGRGWRMLDWRKPSVAG